MSRLEQWSPRAIRPGGRCGYRRRPANPAGVLAPPPQVVVSPRGSTR